MFRLQNDFKEVHVNITVKKGNLVDIKTEAIILALCEGEKTFSGWNCGRGQKNRRIADRSRSKR